MHDHVIDALHMLHSFLAEPVGNIMAAGRNGKSLLPVFLEEV